MASAIEGIAFAEMASAIAVGGIGETLRRSSSYGEQGGRGSRLRHPDGYRDRRPKKARRTRLFLFNRELII